MDDLELRQWKSEAPAGADGSRRVLIIAAAVAVGLGGLAVAAGMMVKPFKPGPPAEITIIADAKAIPATTAASVAKPAAVAAPVSAAASAAAPAPKVSAPAKAKPAHKTTKVVSKKVVKTKVKAKPKAKAPAKKAAPVLDLEALSKSDKKPSRPR